MKWFDSNIHAITISRYRGGIYIFRCEYNSKEYSGNGRAVEMRGMWKKKGADEGVLAGTVVSDESYL